MTALNRTLTAIVDLLFAPLERLPPLAGLAALAAATSVLVLLAFKWTADQAALAATKRSIQAALLEMRLLSDDLPSLFRAQLEALGHTLGYLRLSLVPTAWVIVPVVVLMVHMEFYFGYVGLAPGDAALVKVELGRTPAGSSSRDLPAAALQAPEGIGVETPAVFLPSEREIAWRIRPEAAGSYQLSIRVGGTELKKTLVVSDAVTRRSPVRPSPALVLQLLNPSETPLPEDASVEAVRVTYAGREYEVGGWDVGWAAVYVVLTLVFAFALKGVFGVVM